MVYVFLHGRHWDLLLSCQHHMVLPHACFIYDAVYHSSLDHVILTAGYDKLIYIWTVQSTESRYGQVSVNKCIPYNTKFWWGKTLVVNQSF